MCIVITYRSSGVINFATGALAVYGAETYAFARNGDLLVPIPGLPLTIGLGGPLPIVPAMALSVATSAVLGVALYACVFRPLKNALPAARAVASVGVLLLVESTLALRVGTFAIQVGAIFPPARVHILGISVDESNFATAGTVVALAILMAWLSRATRFGLATRAAAENQTGAIFSGLSPGSIALWNWAIGSGLAALAGILVAPFVPIDPTGYTLFIIPALAAAILGNFDSIGLAVAGGLVLGAASSEATYLAEKYNLPGPGLQALLPLALVVVFLLVRGRPIPSRGELLRPNLPPAPIPRNVGRWVVVWCPIGLVGIFVLPALYRAGLVISFIMAILALSYVVIAGYAGQQSLVQISLAGVGAFLTVHFGAEVGIPFPLTMIIAAVGATAVGMVVSLPSLRIRGLSIMVATLAMAVAIEQFWFNNPRLDDYGALLQGPRLFGFDLGVGSGRAYPRAAFGIVCLVVLALTAVVVAGLRKSHLGAEMLAVRANERSAAAAGIDVARTKVIAFAIGAFIAGIGGSLLAYQQTTMTSDSVDVLTGLSLFAVVYIGGIASISGAMIAGLVASGGLVFVAIDGIAGIGKWFGILSGLGLVVAIIRHPEGVAGGLIHLANRLRGRGSVPPPAMFVGSDQQGRQGLPADDGAELSPPRVVSSTVIFSVTKLSVRYGAVAAVQDVDLEIRCGSIVGLIGPNGAGKTSVIDAVTGFANARGSIALAGVELSSLKAHARVRKGLSRTFQGIELYDDLSVRENVIAAEGRSGRTLRTLFGWEQKSSVSRVNDPNYRASLFSLLGLTGYEDTAVRELSTGYRQLVSIARALASRPSVLLLDEPAAGLDGRETAWLMERLRGIRDGGTGILIVDHDMSFVLGLCDTVYVMDYGQVIAEGAPAEIKRNPAVVAAYLGTPVVQEGSVP
jgi:ABC-type branched-subunit amino acid transport system ATPase component/branched-subunit amino acid ABC-type transport system permease component